MDDNYVPTTEDVRSVFVSLGTRLTWDKRDAAFRTWMKRHDEGQRIKGIQGLLDYRPLPRDVRKYIEYYLESAAEDAVIERGSLPPNGEN